MATSKPRTIVSDTFSSHLTKHQIQAFLSKVPWEDAEIRVDRLFETMDGASADAYRLIAQAPKRPQEMRVFQRIALDPETERRFRARSLTQGQAPEDTAIGLLTLLKKPAVAKRIVASPAFQRNTPSGKTPTPVEISLSLPESLGIWLTTWARTHGLSREAGIRQALAGLLEDQTLYEQAQRSYGGHTR